MELFRRRSNRAETAPEESRALPTWEEVLAANPDADVYTGYENPGSILPPMSREEQEEFFANAARALAKIRRERSTDTQ